MQTEERLERDTDLIQDYIELLNRRAARPSPFGKLAALVKLGLLRRRLATAMRRHPDPELERAEAAAIAETSGSWPRRVATSFWGGRVLMALAMLVGWQFVLFILLLLSAAYTNLTAREPLVDSGYLPAVTRNAIIFLIIFVFAFYLTLPLFSMLVLWGGRFVRSWRVTAPVVFVLLLAAAGATWGTFYKLTNPLFAPDSVHQFIESRATTSANSGVKPYRAYEAWLDMNWLLKDPKLKADYESYLRNGPGRWLTNRFDTTDAAAWSDPQALLYVGELVDQQFDQAKFREWLKDYVERNKINSRNIDEEIDVLVGPANQRFLSVWQAEPYLRDRDVNMRRHYFGGLFKNLRIGGSIFFGAMILLYLLVYAVGPVMLTTGWVLRTVRLEGPAKRLERARARYYALPEQGELQPPPFYEGTVDLLSRVHRSWVRAALAVSVLVFGLVVLWLASRSALERPVATQNALMGSFVAFPSARPATAAPVDVAAGPAVSALPVAGAPENGAFPGGTGDPSVAVDTDGDGVAEGRPLTPLEARLEALQKQIDDADYETRKKFKMTATLLDAYKSEIDALKSRNAQLEQQQSAMLNTTNLLGGRISSVEAEARSAASSAAAADAHAQNAATQVATLADTVEERTDSLSHRADALEKRDDEIQATVDTVASDLDEKTSQLRARTERLGERATDLAERTEEVAQLQRTVYAALVDEFQRQIEAVERRSHSRLYRMFNKTEARAQLADLRRRIQLVRGRLQETDDPEAARIDKELVELQNSIGPVEERYK